MVNWREIWDDECEEYSALSEEELDYLLLKGDILGWGPHPEDAERTAVLCREAFDGRLDRPSSGGHSVSPLPPQLKVGFRLFADAARPGTGIVAVQEGREIGPGGALTLFLAEHRDPGELWFLAPAHVLTNFLWDEPYPDAYRSRQGFTADSRRRKLGSIRDVRKVVEVPKCVLEEPESTLDPAWWNTIDAGLVKLDAVEWKQKTTCYGRIGPPEYLGLPNTPPTRPLVIKCGPEEPHSTGGQALATNWRIRIVHNDCVYLFRDQILVRSGKDDRPPFALPGDSGTLIVSDGSQRPVGMLMAGSVRHNLYFLNSIQELKRYWEEDDGLDLIQAQVAPFERAGEGTTISTSASVAAMSPDSPGARNGIGRGTDLEATLRAVGWSADDAAVLARHLASPGLQTGEDSAVTLLDEPIAAEPGEEALNEPAEPPGETD